MSKPSGDGGEFAEHPFDTQPQEIVQPERMLWTEMLALAISDARRQADQGKSANGLIREYERATARAWIASDADGLVRNRPTFRWVLGVLGLERFRNDIRRELKIGKIIAEWSDESKSDT